MRIERTQADTDEQNEFYGQLTALECKDPSLTRQEQAADTDIHRILSRGGYNAFGKPQPFGEADFTIDLQKAIASVTNAKRWHAAMPSEFHERFPTWQSVLEAANDGVLPEILKDLAKVPDVKPEAKAEAPKPPPQ